MIDPELKTLLDRQFGHIDEQFDLVVRTTKEGFDGVDEQLLTFREDVDARFNAVDARFKTIDEDIAFLKERTAAIADEVRTLSANMVTKQYLESRIETHLGLGKASATRQEAMRQAILALMLLLEKHQILPSEQRARYEALLTA